MDKNYLKVQNEPFGQITNFDKWLHEISSQNKSSSIYLYYISSLSCDSGWVL